MRDPHAAALVAVTHTGFPMARPLPRKIWEPHLANPDAIRRAEELRDSLRAELKVREELDRLEALGISAITWFDPAYPKAWREKLGSKAPPVLFGLGELELLEGTMLAVVGSRHAEDGAIGFAEACAREASARGWGVVSGGARGVDLAAIRSACQSGGTAVAVAADALQEVARRLARSGCGLDRFVTLTANHPETGFTVGQAMGRNKLVYSLADLAVVASCEEGAGGTWAGAVESMDKELCPVGVWVGEGAPPGNLALVRAGAAPVRSVDDVFALELVRKQATLFE